MTRADFLLIGICLMTAALSAVWPAFGERGERTLRISCDGEVMETLKWEERALQGGGRIYYLFLYGESGITWERFDMYPEIPEGVSYNLLSVSESDVSMEAADCRDQICVRHKPISAGGENIICLPHRLVAEIAGSTDTDTPDGMVK